MTTGFSDCRPERLSQGLLEVAAQFLQQFADIQDGHTFAGHRGAQRVMHRCGESDQRSTLNRPRLVLASSSLLRIWRVRGPFSDRRENSRRKMTLAQPEGVALANSINDLNRSSMLVVLLPLPSSDLTECGAHCSVMRKRRCC